MEKPHVVLLLDQYDQFKSQQVKVDQLKEEIKKKDSQMDRAKEAIWSLYSAIGRPEQYRTPREILDDLGIKLNTSVGVGGAVVYFEE